MILMPDLFSFAYVPNWYSQLAMLAEMALPEPWRFKNPIYLTKNPDTPILERYIHAIFKKQLIDYKEERIPSNAAKVAATYFGTGRYENTASRNGYSTWSAWDEDGREWKFQKDVSIAGPDEQKCELVTPILTYGDIETLQELCRQLRHAGAKSDASRGCGVHIHIGAQGHTPQSLRNLANIMEDRRFRFPVEPHCQRRNKNGKQ